MSAHSTFTQGPAPPLSDHFVDDIHKLCPEVFLVCFRSKNKNVVLYQLNLEGGKVSSDEAVRGYWLVLDEGKDYKPYRRRRGIHHDREELSYLDLKFAWGTKTQKLSDHSASFSFETFPFPMTVLYKNGEAKLFTKIENRKFFVRSLYIDASDNINLFNLKDNMKSLYLNTLEVTDPKKTKPVKILITRERKFVIQD